MVASRFTTAAAALILSVAALPTPSHAQASREGPTFAAAGAWPGFSLRRPDIAYDPVNDVYLVVVGSDDPRPVPDRRRRAARRQRVLHLEQPRAYNQTPRVAYGDGEFLVTWLDVRSDPTGNIAWVYGRLLRFGAGGAPTFVGPDFLIGAAVGGVHGKRGAAVAYSTVSKRFLVATTSTAAVGSRATTSAGSWCPTPGSWSAAPINVSFDNHFQGEVGVGYSPSSDKFLVAYSNYYEPAGPSTIQTRTVSAVDGALGTATDVTDAAQHQRARGRLQHQEQPVPPGVVAEHRGAGIYYGRLMNPEGAPAGNTTPLIVNYAGLRFARPRLQRARRHVLRGRPRPRARRVPAGRRRRGSIGRRRAQRRVRSHRHGQQGWQLQPPHRRQHGAQRVDDGDVHRVRGRQRAAHQDARQRRRAAAAPAATAAADRPDRRPTCPTAAGSWPKARRAARRPGSTPSISSPTRTTIPSTRASGSPATTARSKYREFTVAARSRTTISLASVANGAFGAIFQSTTPGKRHLRRALDLLGPQLRGQHRRLGGQGPVHHLVLRRGVARRRAVRQLLPRLQPAARSDHGRRDVPHRRAAR